MSYTQHLYKYFSQVFIEEVMLRNWSGHSHLNYRRFVHLQYYNNVSIVTFKVESFGLSMNMSDQLILFKNHTI